jgi:hypothetical protein
MTKSKSFHNLYLDLNLIWILAENSTQQPISLSLEKDDGVGISFFQEKPNISFDHPRRVKSTPSILCSIPHLVEVTEIVRAKMSHILGTKPKVSTTFDHQNK